MTEWGFPRNQPIPGWRFGKPSSDEYASLAGTRGDVKNGRIAQGIMVVPMWL
jgi:hypothetical protein